MKIKIPKLTKKSQLYILVLSYIVVIVVSIMVNMVGNSILVHSFEQQLKKENMLSMQRIKIMYDTQLSEMQTAASNLLRTTAVNKLNTLDDLSKNIKTSLLNMAKNDIAIYKLSNKLIEECYVLIKNKNICINSNGACDLDLMYEMEFSEFYTSKDLWITDVLSINLKKFVVKEDNDNNKALFLYHTMPFSAKGFEMAVIIRVNLKNENYIDKGQKVSDINIRIDDDNNVLFSDFEEKLNAEIENVKSYTQYKEGKYLISIEPSDENGFYYVTSILNKEYRKRINALLLLSSVTGFICFLLCGCMAYFLSRKHYEPLSTLIANLKEFDNSPEVENEYCYIEKTMKKMVSERAIMEKKIVSQGKILQDSFLRKILSQKVVTEENIEQLKNSGINLDFKAYSIILFDISEKNLDTHNAKNGFDKKMAMFAISNVFDEVMEDTATTFYCEMNNIYICLMGFNDYSYDSMQLKSKIRLVKDFFEETFQVDFICAISEISEHLEDIPNLYDMAIEIIEYSLLQNEKKVIDYSDVSYEFNNYEFKIETKRTLLNLLDLRKKDEAVKVINEIIDFNLKIKKVNIALLRVLFSDIASVLIEAASKSPENSNLDYKLLAVSTLASSFQIENYRHNICLFVSQYCELDDKGENTVGQTRIDRIKEYIELKYADPNLTVSCLADEFGVSLHYLSRFFKAHTKQGLANYIIEYRINKSKVLLKTTDDNINKIAEKVGFSSSGVFMRAFKKIEGVTPSEFRKGSI